MSDDYGRIDLDTVQDIAGAIRERAGTQQTYRPNQFSTAIKGIVSAFDQEYRFIHKPGTFLPHVTSAAMSKARIEIRPIGITYAVHLAARLLYKLFGKVINALGITYATHLVVGLLYKLFGKVANTLTFHQQTTISAGDVSPVISTGSNDPLCWQGQEHITLTFSRSGIKYLGYKLSNGYMGFVAVSDESYTITTKGMTGDKQTESSFTYTASEQEYDGQMYYTVFHSTWQSPIPVPEIPTIYVNSSTQSVGEQECFRLLIS